MSLAPIHILVVEDNLDQSELIQRVLKRQASPMSVTAVTRGPDCLEMLDHEHYSAVLLDYSLPGMDGLSVLKEIRRRGLMVPVIMVTGQGDEKVAVEAMLAGASDYLIKAAGYLTTLPTVISKVLKQHELAMENLRLLEETRARAQEQAALNAIASAVSRSLEVDTLLGLALDKVLEVTGRERGCICLLEPGSGRRRIPVHREVSEEVLKALQPGQARMDLVFAAGAPVVVNDPAELMDVSRAEGVQAVALIPLNAQGKVAGVMVVSTKRPAPFRPQEIELLQAIGNVIGVALENARLYEEARRRTEKLETLARLTRLMTASTEPQEVFDFITQAAAGLLNAKLARLWLRSEERPDELAIRASYGVEKALEARYTTHSRTVVGQGFVGRIAESGEPEFVLDVREDPRWLNPDLAKGLGLSSFTGIPLRLGERVVGVLSVLMDHRTSFSHEERDVLKIFADQAAIALENARLFTQVRRSYEDLRQTQEHLVRVERLRALGEMAAGVAHDFNNLLAVILGRAQYLRMASGQLSPEAVDRSLQIIERSAMDGGETVRHLFEFTRGAPTAAMEPVNLNQIVTEALDASEPRWKDEPEARGITVSVKTALAATRPVLGNAIQLREVLLNLIFNAVDALPQGGRLMLATWEADGSVWLKAADEGIGMAEEVKKRAFEPFFTTKGPQRSGLGLSMAYGIISLHGGTITIESGEGQGTAFLIRLPLASVPETPPAQSPLPSVPPSSVLVIDDEEGVRETLAEIFRATGHTVITAASGREGLEWVEHRPFDLICTDLGMPGISGWQVIRGIRTIRPDAPVALITGWSVQVSPEELSTHEADFLLPKPFQIAAVLKVLEQARLRRSGQEA